MEYRYHCLLLVLVGFLYECCMTVSADWPRGYYGLPMVKTGCPVGATFGWKTGWIFQDTEDKNPSNSKSTNFHIEGVVRESSVNRSICVKTDIAGDDIRHDWPSGSYCIYKRTNSCPSDFISGSVTWGDEYNDNRDKMQGVLPKVIIRHSSTGTRTTINFCCRNDAFKSTPINLPVASPFYLFAHTSVECQQVRWAVATSEWIVYDTEDDNNHYDSVKDSAPYVTNGGNIGHKIHYCYYTNCQYILDTSAGSFHSPRYPGNYPNGQQCSWHISVKASQTIFVHFVNFSLSDVNDQLIFYDGSSDTDRRVATLHGGNTSRDVFSSSSNLFVVFNSDEFGSSSGFKVTYKAIDTSTVLPSTTVTTVKPPTPRTTTTSKIAKTTIEKATIATEVSSKTPQPTDRPDVTLSSRGSSTATPTDEPAHHNGNSSKRYDFLKDNDRQSSLIAVAIVIPLICVIAVIVMAAYLVFRLKNVREKPSDVPVRYSPNSVDNPSYVRGDVVLEARSPSPSSEYKDSKGDIYHEIEASRQTTDNPLYQSTDTDGKHVYASFA